ncbi:MAG: 30S ribosomal protein S6e [Candidatus Micrarchaeota archaeon]|nr:30S ribosomal protein S6e [Candidatus Micrarchaeota archaeon]
MKVVISDPKTGKSYQTDITKDKEASLVGLKLGDPLDGGAVGAAGYKLKITGGSDKDGLPMRSDLRGARKARLLLSTGVGFRAKRKGERRKKSVRGNLVTDQIVQLNTVIVEAGEKKLEELFPPKPKEEKK